MSLMTILAMLAGITVLGAAVWLVARRPGVPGEEGPFIQVGEPPPPDCEDPDDEDCPREPSSSVP